AKTLWAYRERLIRSGVMQELFDRFEQYLQRQGYQARKGQIVDASIVPVPRQRNTREENRQIKQGETPEEWLEDPAKLRQKDRDARWVVKHFERDRKSTRLNSSHVKISYAVFCLKKKNNIQT